MASRDPIGRGIAATPRIHASYRSASVDEAEDWDALESELASDGGPTAHPTGVTLASGDPYSSLNAPEGSFVAILHWRQLQDLSSWRAASNISRLLAQ